MRKIIPALLLAGVLAVSAGAMSGCVSNPAMDGIMHNASTSSKEANASELTNACKTLYAGVASGTVNSETAESELGGLNRYKLPSPDASVQERKDTASALTVGDAIDYQGLSAKFSSANISEYGYDTSYGTIYFRGSNSGAGLSPLSMTTTLGELHGE